MSDVGLKELLMVMEDLEKSIEICKLQRELLLLAAETVCKRTRGPSQDAAIKDLKSVVAKISAQLLPPLKISGVS